MRRRIAACVLAMSLFGCDSNLPSSDEVLENAPSAPPPADALEAHLRELGRERAPFMILDEAAIRGEGVEGFVQDYSHVLHPGWCYKLLGAGGPDVEDLDLRIYGPNDVLLQRDTTQDSEPYIGRMRPICPTTSGTFRIQVRLLAGDGPFAVQVYRSI